MQFHIKKGKAECNRHFLPCKTTEKCNLIGVAVILAWTLQESNLCNKTKMP